MKLTKRSLPICGATIHIEIMSYRLTSSLGLENMTIWIRFSAPQAYLMVLTFFSIDIDGNDYHAWKAVSRYRPKVIVIEFNPTIPTHIRFVQPADQHINQGASLLSLVELGKEKGYELVSVLQFNTFFVKREYYPLFQIESNSPEVLRTSLDDITYLFSGYDGQVFLHGSCSLPWHGIDLKASKVQHLPRPFLRRPPDNYTTLHKIVFKLFLLITRPSRLIKGVRKRIGLPKRRCS